MDYVGGFEVTIFSIFFLDHKNISLVTQPMMQHQRMDRRKFDFLIQSRDGGGTFHLLFWNLHKIWRQKSIDLSSIGFSRRCIMIVVQGVSH